VIRNKYQKFHNLHGGIPGLKKTISVLGILIALFSAVLLVPLASAAIISEETLTIEADQFKWLELEGTKGGSLEIDARIIGEGSMDIFMMDESNFDLYSGGADYDYYEDGSAMNIHTKKYKFEAPKTQTYYFVVDNTEEGIAYTLATIEVKVVISDLGTPFLGAFEVVFALATVFIIMTARRKLAKERT
jgi:hypothetical protein